jgi:3-oxoacyl-[acyl-carrier-protein] synthase II
VILEELEHAKRRGARIYAELIGYGMSGDGCHITAPEPEGKGASLAMRLALKDAKISGDDVDYINAHGTSTPLGDLAETKALKNTFGEHARKVSISSTKSELGHLLGASGGVEAVVACLAVDRNLIPPTINIVHQDPECDLDYTPNKAKDRKIDIAMSNSFGFGGHNAVLLFRKPS